MKPLLLVAAVALIDVDKRVLIAKRPEGKPMAGLWEFPGGKLQPGPGKVASTTTKTTGPITQRSALGRSHRAPAGRGTPARVGVEPAQFPATTGL